MMGLDRKGFFVKSKSLKKDELFHRLMQLFEMVEFAEKELQGDYNWELLKKEMKLKSE